jgi:hypothetical protein
MATKICTVDFDFAEQHRGLCFCGNRFAEFVRENESRLVLAIDSARQLQSRQTLRAVHNDTDRGQQVDKLHLAGSEDRSRRDGELVTASRTFELATRCDLVCVERTAGRAGRLAIGGGPSQLAERLVSLVLAIGVDRLEAEGPGLGG